MTMTGISDATNRITVRRRRGRRRRLVLLAAAAAVLLVVGGLAWVLLGSAAFGVRAVEVHGSKRVSAGDVVRIADVPMGTPLARLDLDAIAARVAGLPPVAKVSVARQWPDTIAIQLTERVPAFAAETPGGYWIVDDTGVIFDSATEVPRGVLPARLPASDPRLIRDLATVVAALPGEVRGKVRVLTAQTPDSITLELTGGTTVVWGGAEQSPLKAQVLLRLMTAPHRVYDVSAPSNPITR